MLIKQKNFHDKTSFFKIWGIFTSIYDLVIREHNIKHEGDTMNTKEYSPVIEVLSKIIG